MERKKERVKEKMTHIFLRLIEQDQTIPPLIQYIMEKFVDDHLR
jgi:hypothetical protein